jgi:hypothetical protein
MLILVEMQRQPVVRQATEEQFQPKPVLFPVPGLAERNMQLNVAWPLGIDAS